ncbi:MAG TPA: thiamine pyrophosphate-requiring protein [Xanthobacteraceae bacterium]|nr:thiamine pyrophosphate-requiring protein [Xanthobacteraceae bacterium]
MNHQHPRSVAAAYLALLAERGVDYLFGNAGTDFAPLIEAYAQAAQTGGAAPRPILATHENLAVSMAHGYAMVSRRIPAVMVHVSVGTANMVCAALNAARENVAILLTAGRSPLTESGLPGSRDGYIHWAQEMYDQAGMLREIVKWDYELRNGEQLATVVDRALTIAASEPRGPVYLSLPREVIAAPMPDRPAAPRPFSPASASAPDATAVAAAARLIAQAKRPLIVTANAGRDAAAFAALGDFAARFAIPVVQHRPRYFSLPSSHPMNLGFDPARHVPNADAILVIECDVPWLPSRTGPGPDCKVVHCGLDPLFARYPIRGFPCDVAITASTVAALSALSAALADAVDAAAVAHRRRLIMDERAALTAGWQAAGEAAARKNPLDPAWVSHCIGRAKDPRTIVVNEYTLFPEHCAFEHPDLYFGSSSASGLGWGAGAALGAKLARPESPVMAVVGDGAYMFSNPAAVHHASALHELPVLFVVTNNSMWGAVERSTRAMYPDGRAAKSNDPPFVRLKRLPAFERICEAAGGYGERVEDPAALPGALARAMAVVADEKRQALLNVICGAGGTA